METISVIIPVYNAAATVAKCLDSLLAQTYPEVEIIAVNDGSSDDSANICAQYASKYPNVIFLDKEKAGVSAARNYALDRCTGSWLSFIDSDDSIDINYYADMIELAEKDGLDLVVADLEYVSSAGLRVLLTAHTAMAKKGGMKLLHVNEEIMDSLAVTGLANVLNIAEE